MDYVTESGYGNCQKNYLNGPICYVNEPTNCSDVINAGSDGPTGYSWDACRNNTGKRNIHDACFDQWNHDNKIKDYDRIY